MATATRLGAIGLLLLAGGCASKEPAPPSWVTGPWQALAQGDTPPPEHSARPIRVEMEADGLPAQLALRHPTPIADDPREPWSPNYGKAAAPAPAPALDYGRLAEKLAAAKPGPEPSGLQPPPQARPLSPDDIVRLAIAAHEMRRQD